MSKDKLKLIITLAVFALIIAGAAVVSKLLYGKVLAPNVISIGNSDEESLAPDFSVLDIDGNVVKLSDMKGKPVVLNFWASWCPPCKTEMPDFDKVYKELGQDVQFMMICLVDGSRETIESGKAYIAKEGFYFPIYFDTKQEAVYAYGIRSIPTTFFIDSKGFVIAGTQGAISESTLRRGIELIR
ncbi:MAG: redoxin domain-containing protein [Treponema sp.]|jgi:thiol-disulfide isomerase/thioredoxin|nr:redoxin domain-containing protein [Treponema sp.]